MAELQTVERRGNILVLRTGDEPFAEDATVFLTLAAGGIPRPIPEERRRLTGGGQTIEIDLTTTERTASSLIVQVRDWNGTSEEVTCDRTKYETPSGVGTVSASVRTGRWLTQSREAMWLKRILTTFAIMVVFYVTYRETSRSLELVVIPPPPAIVVTGPEDDSAADVGIETTQVVVRQDDAGPYPDKVVDMATPATVPDVSTKELLRCSFRDDLCRQAREFDLDTGVCSEPCSP